MQNNIAGTGALEKPDSTGKLDWVAKLWIAFGFVFVFAIIYFGASLVEDYEKKTYVTSLYTDAEEQIILRLKVDQICEAAKKEKEKESCERLTNLLNEHAGLNDLAAQETVALATRGLLWIGFLQAVVAATTLAFLIWTVLITRDMRKEATNATISANTAANATIRAEGAFLVVEPICRLCKKDKGHFDFFVQITNYGRTSALDIKGWVDYGAEAAPDGGFARMSRAFPKAIAGGESYVIEQTRIHARVADYCDSLTGRFNTNIKGHCPITYSDIFTPDARPAISEGFHIIIDFEGSYSEY